MNAIELKLFWQLRAPTKLQVDKKHNWIIVFPDTVGIPSVEAFPYADILVTHRQRLRSKLADAEPVLTDLPNKIDSHVSIACVTSNTKVFNLLTPARKLVAAHDNAETISVTIIGFEPIQSERIAEAIVVAGYARAAEMPSFKSAERKKKSLKYLELFGIRIRHRP